MKKLMNIIYLATILIASSVSCKKDLPTDIPEISIEFSDGSIIHEHDIVHYDSSTCIFYLKEKIQMVVAEEDSVLTFTEFIVKLGQIEIYKGILYPDMQFSRYENQPHIFSRTFPGFDSDFLEIVYREKEIINDQRLLDRLNSIDLFSKGITCTINNTSDVSDNETRVSWTFTLQNHSMVDYYIIDPEKMGVLRFNRYMEGLTLTTPDNHTAYTPTWSEYQPNDDKLLLEDLSLLKGKKSLTFNIITSYSYLIPQGNYSSFLRYNSMGYYRPIALDTRQDNGTIWIGKIYLEKDIEIN